MRFLTTTRASHVVFEFKMPCFAPSDNIQTTPQYHLLTSVEITKERLSCMKIYIYKKITPLTYCWHFFHNFPWGDNYRTCESYHVERVSLYYKYHPRVCNYEISFFKVVGHIQKCKHIYRSVWEVHARHRSNMGFIPLLSVKYRCCLVSSTTWLSWNFLVLVAMCSFQPDSVVRASNKA